MKKTLIILALLFLKQDLFAQSSSILDLININQEPLFVCVKTPPDLAAYYCIMQSGEGENKRVECSGAGEASCPCYPRENGGNLEQDRIYILCEESAKNGKGSGKIISPNYFAIYEINEKSQSIKIFINK
jgi:hypothetical protein